MENYLVTHYFKDYKFQELISKANFNEGNQVFHYASIDTLLKILEKKKLRFSNRLYLNDYSEGRYVLDLCTKEIGAIWPNGSKYDKGEFLDEISILSEHLNNKQFHIYQASFSLNNDSLTMWNYYARENGANIKFSLQELVKSFGNQFVTSSQWPVGFLHSPVIYDKEQQADILKELLKDFENCSSINDEWYMFTSWAILYIGTFFKHEGFRDEQEYRMAYNLFFNPRNQEQCLTLRSNKREEPYCVELWQKENMLVPYIDVDFEISDVEGIVLSPRVKMDDFTYGLNILLRQNEYDVKKVEISKSEIPVRF